MYAIRSYYDFGLAAAGWLLHPLILGGLALAVCGILYRRDYRVITSYSIHYTKLYEKR